MDTSYEPFTRESAILFRHGRVTHMGKFKYYVTHKTKVVEMDRRKYFSMKEIELEAIKKSSVQRIRFVLHNNGKVRIFSLPKEEARGRRETKAGCRNILIPIEIMTEEGVGLE